LLVFNFKMDAEDDLLGHSLDWVEELSTRCVRVDVITGSLGKGSLPSNVHVHNLGSEKRESRICKVVNFYVALIRVLRRGRPQGCFAHMNHHYTVLAGPILRALNIPVIQWHCHRATPWTLRVAHYYSDVLVTATPESCRLPVCNRVITGHGINTDRYKLRVNSGSGPFRLLYVGRIAPIKRLELLFEAAAWMVKHAPSFEFTIDIIGDASPENEEYKQSLLEMISRAGVANQVQFHGRLPHKHVAEKYQNADLCINCCPEGGLDKMMLEAMCSGVPVLTTNPALKHAWPGECGAKWFHPEQDGAEIFAKRIIDWAAFLMSPPIEFHERLRTAVVLHHGLKQFVDRLLRMFGQFCDDRHERKNI
jgi:glycosyltransferase involved in cell wall biosynthesis